MPLKLTITYASGTYVNTDLRFRFVGGRAICPDGTARMMKRVSPEWGELTTGRSIRAAVDVFGKTVTGSLILRRPSMDEPDAFPLEFTPDPTGVNADIFARA